MKKVNQGGKFLEKMTTQLRYPVIPEKTFANRRSSCPTRNVGTILSSDQAEDCSLLSTDKSVSNIDESREGINPEWTSKTQRACTAIQKGRSVIKNGIVPSDEKEAVASTTATPYSKVTHAFSAS